MELNKSSITNLIIAASVGLVLGAGATYYYYDRNGGEMDKRLAAATAGINAAREQQQREIAELQGLVIALQSNVGDSKQVTEQIRDSRTELEELNRILDRENAAVNELDIRETADREAIRRSKQIVDSLLRELQEKTSNH